VSSLSGREPLTFSDICRAYADGDKEAHIALGQCANDLARALVGTINIVGADHVLIGGQLRLAGDEFAAELTSVLRKRLFPGLANRISVGFASLPPYAGAWGVASQVLAAAWETGQFAEVSG
jgi:predicted NBD/HSP70 family sugar kinase